MSDGAAVLQTLRFETIHCCKCGMTFAVPADIRSRWQASGSFFYCPAGHSQHYSESQVQKLEKQLSAERKYKEWAEQDARNQRIYREQAERKVIGQKAAKTRLRNRIKNGVCPCCTRSFANLRAHILTKHPEFQPSEPGDEAPAPT